MNSLRTSGPINPIFDRSTGQFPARKNFPEKFFKKIQDIFYFVTLKNWNLKTIKEMIGGKVAFIEGKLFFT
jgi:hypothetical protein